MEVALEERLHPDQRKEDQLDERTCSRCSSRSRSSGKPLLIIAEDARSAEALATLVILRQQAAWHAASRSRQSLPGFGDPAVQAMLQDIAILTGGKAITEATLGIKLENVQIQDLGQAKKITIDKGQHDGG